MTSQTLLEALLDDRSDDGAWRGPLLDHWADLVAAHCPPGSAILEPMCGLGGQSRALAKRVNGSVIGFDVAPDVVAAANRLFSGGMFQCYHLDILERPQFSAQFDVVLLGYEALNAFPVGIWSSIITWVRSLCAPCARLILDLQVRHPRRLVSSGLDGIVLQADIFGRLVTFDYNKRDGVRISQRYVCSTEQVASVLSAAGFQTIWACEVFDIMEPSKLDLKTLRTIVAVAV